MEKKLTRDELDPESSNADAWDARYRVEDTPWDGGVASPGLADYLDGHSLQGEVFVPGCGRGHDVRVLARHGLQVTGLDISAAAIERAESFDPAGGERYLAGDLFALPDALRGRFDWVWEHTCFCAVLPEQRAAWLDAVEGSLKPGGRMLGIFFIAPESDTDGPPFRISVKELRPFLEQRFTIDAEWPPKRYYPGREGAEWMVRGTVR